VTQIVALIEVKFEPAYRKIALSALQRRVATMQLRAASSCRSILLLTVINVIRITCEAQLCC
jgi:hypothetical protein